MEAYRLNGKELKDFLRKQTDRDVWMASMGRNLPWVVISSRDVPELAQYQCPIGQFKTANQGDGSIEPPPPRIGR